jgi:hypothetical protein
MQYVSMLTHAADIARLEKRIKQLELDSMRCRITNNSCKTEATSDELRCVCDMCLEYNAQTKSYTAMMDSSQQ